MSGYKMYNPEPREKSLFETLGEGLSKVGEVAGEIVGEVAEQTGKLAGKLVEQTAEIVGELAEQMGEVVGELSEQMGEVAITVADGVKKIYDTVFTSETQEAKTTKESKITNFTPEHTHIITPQTQRQTTHHTIAKTQQTQRQIVQPITATRTRNQQRLTQSVVSTHRRTEIATANLHKTYTPSVQKEQQIASLVQALSGLKELQLAQLKRELVDDIYSLQEVQKLEFVKIKYFTGGEGIDSDKAARYARFAAHVYGGYSNRLLPEQCSVIEKHNGITGLRATLYDDNGTIVCAFAGTDIIDVRDLAENVTQAVGVPIQYQQALSYGKEVCRKYPGKKVVFVGHSKGGGEAAFCAYNLGREAETYNPAGLGLITKYVVGDVRKGAVINAYVFATDLLNKFQDMLSVLIGADGDRHDIRDADAKKHGIHGIEGILRYFQIKYKY